MNAKGHSIRSIYMSGGQAKNAMLMQLFANTCNMPVVLPQSSGAAVVLGAAMLLAAERAVRRAPRAIMSRSFAPPRPRWRPPPPPTPVRLQVFRL